MARGVVTVVFFVPFVLLWLVRRTAGFETDQMLRREKPCVDKLVASASSDQTISQSIDQASERIHQSFIHQLIGAKRQAR